MQFGYIEINGQISQIFINKDDNEIQTIAEKLRVELNQLSINITWDNFRTQKCLDDLQEFMESEKSSY